MNQTPSRVEPGLFDFKKRNHSVGKDKKFLNHINKDIKKKVVKLSQTTQHLSSKVTGVNFYLKDLAHTTKIKLPPATEEELID
jgi:hypothetical protein